MCATNIFVVVEGASDSDGAFTPVPQGSSADRSQWREPTRTSEGLCSLYEAALCLFEEVRIKTRPIPDLGVTFLLENNNIQISYLQALSCSYVTNPAAVLPIHRCLDFGSML